MPRWDRRGRMELGKTQRVLVGKGLQVRGQARPCCRASPGRWVPPAGLCPGRGSPRDMHYVLGLHRRCVFRRTGQYRNKNSPVCVQPDQRSVEASASSSFWLMEGDVSSPCETIDAELLREDVQTLLRRFGPLLNTAIGFPRRRLVAGYNSGAGALRSGDSSRDDVPGGQDSDKSQRFPWSSGHGIAGILSSPHPGESGLSVSAN